MNTVCTAMKAPNHWLLGTDANATVICNALKFSVLVRTLILTSSVLIIVTQIPSVCQVSTVFHLEDVFLNQ